MMYRALTPKPPLEKEAKNTLLITEKNYTPFQKKLLSDFSYFNNINGITLEKEHFLKAATGCLQQLLNNKKCDQIQLSPQQKNHLQAVSLFYKFKIDSSTVVNLVCEANPILLAKVPLELPLEKKLYQAFNEQYFNYCTPQDAVSQKVLFSHNTKDMLKKIQCITGVLLHAWQFFEAVLGRVPLLLHNLNLYPQNEEILWAIQHYGYAFSKNLPKGLLIQEYGILYTHPPLPHNTLFTHYHHTVYPRPSLKKLQKLYDNIVNPYNLPVVCLLNADIFFCAYTGNLSLLQLTLEIASSEKKNDFNGGYNSTLLLAISLAIETSQLEIVQYLLHQNRNKPIDKRTPIHLFVKKWVPMIIHHNNLTMMRLLFTEFGPLLNNEDLTSAFQLAVIEKKPHMVSCLFEIFENTLNPLLRLKIFHWAVHESFFLQQATGSLATNPICLINHIALFCDALSQGNKKEAFLNALFYAPHSCLKFLLYSLEWAICKQNSLAACILLSKLQEYLALREDLHKEVYQSTKEHLKWLFICLHNDKQLSSLQLPLLQHLNPTFLPLRIIFDEQNNDGARTTTTELYQIFGITPLAQLEEIVPTFEDPSDETAVTTHKRKIPLDSAPSPLAKKPTLRASQP